MNKSAAGGLVLQALAALILHGSATGAPLPWPAETNTLAVKLTAIDAGLDAINWSGAAWNPDTRTLWLACNSGYFWALVEDGAGSFRVATNAAGTKATWTPGGDLEGIGQADFGAEVVYLMDENGWIREYDVSQYGVVSETCRWDIRAQCPEVGGAGPEGISFVPDEWLEREGFCDTNGLLYVSTNGMGGVMFVGHQSGGYVHVFDLGPVQDQYGYVGRYLTGRSEIAGLEFDRATGLLYIWHNTGANYLEVTELNSYASGADRRLRTLVEYTGPRAGNLEGFAMVTAPGTDTWCFVTDDDNLAGEALTWYRQYDPADDADADDLADGWELWHFGSATQTTGIADSDADGLTNAGEYTAGTDPTNAASVLAARAAEGYGGVWLLSWSSITGRTYTVYESAGLEHGVTQVFQAGVAGTSPLNVPHRERLPPGPRAFLPDQRPFPIARRSARGDCSKRGHAGSSHQASRGSRSGSRGEESCPEAPAGSRKKWDGLFTKDGWKIIRREASDSGVQQGN